METLRQFEIRQEARFVLWALRCAVAGQQEGGAMQAELVRGFELADVAETTGAFGCFAAALCSQQWAATVWHDPRCCCVSTEELLVLQALARTAERQRQGVDAPDPWWLVLLPVAAIAAVEWHARAWLAALERAGVVFPTSSELLECLRPMERLLEPAPAQRVH